MMDNKRKLFLLALLVTLLFTLGCGKVTKENYDKLKMGMEYSQPSPCTSGKP